MKWTNLGWAQQIKYYIFLVVHVHFSMQEQSERRNKKFKNWKSQWNNREKWVYLGVHYWIFEFAVRNFVSHATAFLTAGGK